MKKALRERDAKTVRWL